MVKLDNKYIVAYIITIIIPKYNIISDKSTVGVVAIRNLISFIIKYIIMLSRRIRFLFDIWRGAQTYYFDIF